MAEDEADPLGYSSTYGKEESADSNDKKTVEPPEAVSTGAPKAIGIRDPSGNLYDTPDAYINERERIYAKSQKAVEDYNAIVAPYREKLFRMYSQAEPKPPEAMPEPNQPNVPPPDPYQARNDRVTGHGWGAVGEAIGLGIKHAQQRALASSVPQLVYGEHARNAFGAAIGGLATKTYTGTAAQQYEEYQLALDATKRYNEEHLNGYKQLLANRKLELDNTIKLIGLAAQEHLDPVMAQKANAKDLPGLIKELENREKAERNRLSAIDNWKQKWQKSFIDRHSDYVYMMKEKGIDLTDPDPKNFDEAIKKANKKYPLEKFMEEKAAKQAEPAPGEPAKPRYSIDNQKTDKADPLSIRGKATDEEKKKFSEEINSLSEGQ